MEQQVKAPRREQAFQIQTHKGQVAEVVRLVEKEDGAEKAPKEEGPGLVALYSLGSRSCDGDQPAGNVCGSALGIHTWGRGGNRTWQRKKVGGSAILMKSLADFTDSMGSSEARSGCP